MTLVVEPLSIVQPLSVSEPLVEPIFESVSEPLSEPVTFDSDLIPTSNEFILEEVVNHAEVIEINDSFEEVDEEIGIETRDDVSS